MVVLALALVLVLVLAVVLYSWVHSNRLQMVASGFLSNSASSRDHRGPALGRGVYILSDDLQSSQKFKKKMIRQFRKDRQKIPGGVPEKIMERSL